MRVSNSILYGFVISPMYKAIITQINHPAVAQRAFTEQLEINQVVNKFPAFMELGISSISSPKAKSGSYPKIVWCSLYFLSLAL
jgi:hypothetical protein